MRKAIALISYCRDEYFQLVYPTLIYQKIFGKNVSECYDIYIFQDGLAEDARPEEARKHTRLQNRITRLHRKDRVHLQEQNLGVARHFDYLEKFLFIEKGYDYVVFYEEDMILAPGYMQVMDLMGEKFWKDSRVGMVSAFRERTPNEQDYVMMQHNWGFGRWKEKWMNTQKLVNEYLGLLGNGPYHKRNEPEIFRWLSSKGFKPQASSQDYLKNCGIFSNSELRIAFKWNYGLPIGREGLHSRREHFEKIGLDKITISTREVPDKISELNEGIFQELLANTRREIIP
jgi:hypothetical protein